MAEAITDSITTRLASATAERSRASLAVSGGSTPKALYERLAQCPSNWGRVSVVLVDERWVEPATQGSNETFVRESLLQGEARTAQFVGLKTAADTPQKGLGEAEARLSDVPSPFDAVVLGMGDDGHTASWFPHANGLTSAIARKGKKVAAIDAPKTDVTGPFTQRITLTRAALSGAREIHLLLSGASKRNAWEAAMGPGDIEDMPVRVLLRDPEIRLQTHWAP